MNLFMLILVGFHYTHASYIQKAVCCLEIDYSGSPHVHHVYLWNLLLYLSNDCGRCKHRTICIAQVHALLC
jgi:hypothetical protein